MPRIAIVAVLCASLITCSAAQPFFSWDRVPVYFHSANVSGPLNAETLELITSHNISIVTIEKFQAQYTAPVNSSAETKIVDACRQVKAAKPEIMCLFYLNSIMDWNMYNLHQIMLANPGYFLRDVHGNPVTIFGQTVFDFTQPAVQELWLDVLRNASQSGVIDGAFLDRGTETVPGNVSPAKAAEWNAAHALLVTRVQAEVFPRGVVISNNGVYPNVTGRMFERFLLQDFDQNTPLADLTDFATESALGHVIEIHGEGGSMPSGACDPATFNSTLAAYLVGASEFAYYACTAGWTLTSGWQIWYPDFDRPLGAPHGPATVKPLHGGTFLYERSFATGTRVSLTISNQTAAGCICWSDGAETGAPGCCSTPP